MLDAEPPSQRLACQPAWHSPDLRQKVHGLRREVGADDSTRLQAIVAVSETRDGEGTRDALSTRLMESFRRSSGRGCFGSVYELNASTC
jgi:hypothetical protein